MIQTYSAEYVQELEQRIEKLEGALRKIANTPPVHPLALGAAAIAREALTEKNDF